MGREIIGCDIGTLDGPARREKQDKENDVLKNRYK